MNGRRREAAVFSADKEGFAAATAYVGDLLAHAGVRAAVANDAVLVFEALLQEVANQSFGADTQIEISSRNRYGDTRIIMGFDGKMLVPPSGGDENSPERLVLGALADKVDYSYHAGHNTVRITVARGYRIPLLYCTLAAIFAAATYAPIALFMDNGAQKALLDGYVFPLERLYVNAVLMVGTLVTFFSLLKNLTDTYIVSERHSGIRRLQVRTLGTSSLAIVLAVVTGFLLGAAVDALRGSAWTYFSLRPSDASFAEVVKLLVPSSIFEPFASLSPIPLLVVAMLTTYALCSMGRHFDVMKKAVDACHALFSRMLGAVTAALPFFCFVALLDVMLDYGYAAALAVAGLLVLMAASTIVLLASYAVRLRLRGIHVVSCAKKLVPLLRENLKIGSVIAAAPFNVRYCAKHYGMDRVRLTQRMPVLAEINLDGNCYLIMLGSLLFAFLTGTEIPPVHLLGISLLVMFLSLGAPNQPGSFLIGSLIIFTYLNAPDEVLPVAIYAEAFLGWLQNLVNVTGDVVIAAISDREERRSGVR